jgi:hypothetical protein
MTLRCLECRVFHFHISGRFVRVYERSNVGLRFVRLGQRKSCGRRSRPAMPVRVIRRAD